MKVAALTLSVSRQAAGMLDCVRRLLQVAQREHCVEVEIVSVIDDQTEHDRASWAPLPLHLFGSRGPKNLAYAPAMAGRLRQLQPDLAHTFGLWTYQSRVTHTWSRQARKSYLVTPQGMLDPWARNNSRWRKWVAGMLYENRHLRDAACLQATCQAELEAIRAFGLSNPVCLVPNGVDLPVQPSSHSSSSPWENVVPAEQKILLYLGRLHPKKGLGILLQAWAVARTNAESLAEEWTLVIAGWDQGKHELELRKLATLLGLGRNVVFTGPLFGSEKAGAYGNADAFVLPSLSEGLPLVVLEAWSYRLPVLMTPECNLPEGFSAGAALRADPNVNSLAAALDNLFRATPTELRDMGSRGRTLVEQKFTWSAAARAMSEVYRWLVNDGPQPNCIVD